MNEQKQFKVLSWAFSFLEDHGRERGVAEILLQHYLKVNRTTFFMRMQEAVPEDICHLFKRDIKAHVESGIPVQHLIGYEYFYGRKFDVNEHVLIPRMETEELVLHVVNHVNEQYAEEEVSIVDVGTGSSVIATTLALEIPNAIVSATDISKDALRVAEQNVAAHNAEVTFYEGNFLQPIIDANIDVDIIVSNPPYISWQDEPSLSDTVKDYDPALALFAEEDGLAAYKEILEQVKHHLKHVKQIYFEIGYNQKVAITNITQQIFPECEIECIQDINEKDRIIAISF